MEDTSAASLQLGHRSRYGDSPMSQQVSLTSVISRYQKIQLKQFSYLFLDIMIKHLNVAYYTLTVTNELAVHLESYPFLLAFCQHQKGI